MSKKNRRHHPQPSNQSLTLAQMTNNYHVTNQSLPSAEEIAKFSVIDSNMPKRIMDDALAHSKSARDNETTVVRAVAREANANAAAAIIRILVLSALLLGVFGTGLYLLINGKPLEGFAVLIPAVVWLIKKM